jgi:hypothetical protein
VWSRELVVALFSTRASAFARRGSDIDIGHDHFGGVSRIALRYPPCTDLTDPITQIYAPIYSPLARTTLMPVNLRPLLLAAALLSGTCLADAPVQIRHVTLDEFMPGYLKVSIPLPLSVPASFELASFHNQPQSRVFYWMPKSEVAHVEESGDLPGDTGYMHAEISTNVGYSAEKDLFIGAEDLSANDKAQADALFTDLRMDRCTFGKFPVLVMDMKARQNGRHVRAMYVATLIDTNAVYVAYVAPRQHDEVGDGVWNDMKRSLTCGKNRA